MTEGKKEEFDIEKLKKEFNLSEDAIKNSDFSVDELNEIYQDYLGRIPELEKLTKQFLSEYIFTNPSIRIHSFSGRVKAPYHLIEKIIRKKTNNIKKYKNMTTKDYYKYITDLIGCRVLLVYKEDWLSVHDFLIEQFDCSSSHFIRDDNYADSYDRLNGYTGIVEKPKAFIRKGDFKDLYEKRKEYLIIDEMGYYRSIHYIIKYNNYYIELQVRSLFDEAWGEVDHDVLYPYFKDNKVLVQFSQFINRLSGMGDELSTYFKDFVKNSATISKATYNPLLDTPRLFSNEVDIANRRLIDENEAMNSISEDDHNKSTPNEELMNIIKNE